MYDTQSPGARAGATGAGMMPSRAAWQKPTLAKIYARCTHHIMTRPLPQERGMYAAFRETSDVPTISFAPFHSAASALLVDGADLEAMVMVAFEDRPDIHWFQRVPLRVAATETIEDGERRARIRARKAAKLSDRGEMPLLTVAEHLARSRTGSKLNDIATLLDFLLRDGSCNQLSALGGRNAW